MSSHDDLEANGLGSSETHRTDFFHISKNQKNVNTILLAENVVKLLYAILSHLNQALAVMNISINKMGNAL